MNMLNDRRVNKFTPIVLLVLGVMVTVYVFLNMGEDYSELSQTIRISHLISASIELVRRGGRRVVEVRNMDASQINQLSKGLTDEGKDEYVTMGDKVSLSCHKSSEL